MAYSGSWGIYDQSRIEGEPLLGQA